MKQIVITEEFERIDKTTWPKYVINFLQNPDINSIHVSRLGSRLYFHKFNTEAYPRLAFLEEKDPNGNTLYVVRKFFKQHRDYDVFNSSTEENRLQRCKYSPSEQSEIDEIFAKLQKNNSNPMLPTDMRDFERQRDFSNTSTTYVFEMEEWCKHFFKESKYKEEKLLSAIRSIVIDKKECTSDQDGWFSKEFDKGKEIIFRVHEKENHALYYFFDLGSNVDKIKLKNNYCNLTNYELLRKARKGYPDWILYGEFDEWIKLENDDEANLALSDEEIEVLNNTQYPFFINGLAGSGKSTILYYLFAHAFSHRKVKPLDLLFISYSTGLVTKAKSVIKSLLSTNPNYSEYNFDTEEASQLDLSLCDFQSFLKDNFIKTEDETIKFMSSKHLTYDQFQKDYQLNCRNSLKRNYSAVMVWSVIRTYIKGRDYKNNFNVQSYSKLRASERTVDIVDYQNIYTIWKNWYKPTYVNRWDDLDLVSYILKKIDKCIDYQKYDIIYCDEAQDFTPIENYLILRLSKYSNYNLKGFKNIPIAYAGDPNQTVNPTGFNWKRLKEIVDNSFSSLVGNHISLIEKTLNNNYRSKRTVVEFANSIQYIRKSFLSDDIVMPQEQWNPQANPLPGFFFLTNDDPSQNAVNVIKEGFQYTECIITGAEGEYNRELDSDTLTQDSTAIDDELLSNIDNKTKLYTAISSKGQEFRAVLLYRFADQLPKSFAKLLNKEDIENVSEQYELSHFFTKLYIAVSRAKEVLYIADTQENYNNFWIHFIDNSFVRNLMNGRQDKSDWESKVGGIEIGDSTEFLKRMQANFNPLETAHKIYSDAKLSRNAKDMNRASGYFEEAGEKKMSELSKAYVLLFDKKYLEAGNKFNLLNEKDMATKAFWEGCCWEELVSNSNREIYKIVSKFMIGECSILEFVNKEDIKNSIRSSDDTWKQVVIRISEEAIKIKNDIPYVCSFLKDLVQIGFEMTKPILAELYYKCGKYHEAIAQWDDLYENTKEKNYIENNYYYAAKEETCDSTSDKIYWMRKGGKNNDILKYYSSPRDADTLCFDDRARKIIFDLLLKPDTFEKALNYPYDSDDRLKKLYNCDKIQFIEQYVLSDFNEEKYANWIEQPIKENDSNLFDKPLPVTLFKKIFSLPLMDEWILFMKLKDANGYRVMKKGVNMNSITDAVCLSLDNKYYISLASCFLDIAFNTDNYNFEHINKHYNTLLNIFKKDDISTRDFIAASKRNIYFEQVGLKGHELDIIKDRLREFVEIKVNRYKRIKQKDHQDICTLFKIYEIAAPHIMTSRRDFEYDYNNVISFYNKFLRNKEIPKELKEYVKSRKALINARYCSDSNDNIIENLQQIILSCDKEDFIWIIGFIFGNQKVDKMIFDNYGNLFTEAIYKYKITLNDLGKKEIKITIKNNFLEYADKQIESILKNNFDEYTIKLHLYLYEVFIDGENNTIKKAQKYDELSKSLYLKEKNSLIGYLQKRALHFYSYINENTYRTMSREYGIATPIDKLRKENYPDIRNVNNPSSTNPSIEIMNENEVARKAQFEMVKKLKELKVPIETIYQTATLLTREEIDKI